MQLKNIFDLSGTDVVNFFDRNEIIDAETEAHYRYSDAVDGIILGGDKSEVFPAHAVMSYNVVAIRVAESHLVIYAEQV